MCILYILPSTKDLNKYLPEYKVGGVNCCVHLPLHLLLVQVNHIMLNQVQFNK